MIHERANYKMAEAARLLSMHRATLYDEIRLGRIKTNGTGRSRRISWAQIDAYLLLLEQEAGWVRTKAS